MNEMSRTVLLEIPRDRVRSTSGAGFTSKRQLTFISRAIEQRFDLRVLTAFRDSQQLTDLESGLRALLVRRFAGLVVDARMSFPTSDHALVWVTLGVVPDATSADVKEHVTNFLLDSQIVCDGIEFLSPALPEPSTIAILRTVKTHAPVALDGIAADLRKRGMPSPSDRWLAGRLDSARKRGLLVRQKIGTYILTAAGLQIVPHNRSGSSSDVDRMLAMAKRRQW
ncbi:MAG: hypothetical protein H7232_04300 [Aeromicrobium sp.]|nr:hypothetical protein [Burkholderiales bacterium]